MPETLDDLRAMSFVSLRHWVRDQTRTMGIDREFSGRRVKALAGGLLDELERLAQGEARTWADPTPEIALRNVMRGSR